MNRTARCLVLLVLALLVGMVPVFAHEGEASATIVNGPEGLVVPAELHAGIVDVTFTNITDAPFAPLLARLNDGVTVDALMAAMSAGPEAGLPLITLLGGTEIAPQSSFVATFDLKAGEHVLLNFAGKAPDVKTFTVADEDDTNAAAPEADVQVSLLDFAFSLPTSISAGEQTWLLENKGDQWHEMAIARIDDRTTVAELRDIMQTMASGEADPATLPIEQVGFWMPMQQGERAWFNLNLEPGTYVVACFLPDFASGHAHINLGMVQLLTVTE
ncbi:MAG: hypothetical protein HZC41_26485 [Chloroflexi bacterium]|nr:hypothetical protein [Chloroflexota bacterium]